MVEKGKQESWSEYLDETNENKIFVRFVWTPDFKEIEEFAVIYIGIIWGDAKEIVRYDCCKKETVHIHYFFKKPEEKKFLNKEKNFETIEEFIEDIRKNWRIYKTKFLEK